MGKATRNTGIEIPDPLEVEQVYDLVSQFAKKKIFPSAYYEDERKLYYRVAKILTGYNKEYAERNSDKIKEIGITN